MAKSKRKTNHCDANSGHNQNQEANDQESKESSLEYGWKVLERTDSWINSCDSKVSMLIGIVGVILTIFITTDSISKSCDFLKERITDVASEKAISSVIILILIAGALCLAGISLYHIFKVSIARINENKYKQENLKHDSNLFFGTVANRDYKDYHEDFINESADEQLRDIISQVYINSCIAKKKHHHYNKAIRWLLFTFLYCGIIAMVAKIMY